MTLQIHVATRKGVWIARAGADRRAWSLRGPHFLGTQCHHVVLDPRDGRTLLCASRQWHLGPTVFRSLDGGATWKEAASPPRFPTGEPRARAVDHVFWLTPGHASEPGVWYAGTSPKGLFRSSDGGVTWEPVSGFNDHPMQETWVGGDKDQTPDGGKLHSILVDPRDPRHLYLSMSGGGTFESTDRGASWSPLNLGVAMDFAPPKDDGSEYEFGHDPHCVVQHPLRPDRLWMQNHCGIYRIDRPSNRWNRVGRAMPADVGDVGFSIVAHPRDPDTAWVFPMDGTRDWPRTPPGGRPAFYRTRDGGASWERQDAGFPREQAWWTVKRQAMCSDSRTPLGLYFGTTNGEIWASDDEGASFHLVFKDLPHVYALTLSRSRETRAEEAREARVTRVVLPSQLFEYSRGEREVEASGATLDALLDDLDHRFPGLKFRVIDEQRRVRRHVILFVGEARVEDLDTPIPAGVAVHVVGALSGG